MSVQSAAEKKRNGIEKSPTGIPGLDEVTGGGIPNGRPTLLFGGPGCGKTVMAIESLVHGATNLGEPGVYVSFEEPVEAIIDNTVAFGWDLEGLQEKKLLALDHIDLNAQPFVESGQYDLEPILLRIESAIERIGAQRVALDTLEKLYGTLSDAPSVRAGVDGLLKRLRRKGVTLVFTAEARELGGTRLGFEDYLTDCAIYLDHRITEEVSTRRLRIVKYRGSGHETNEYPYLIDEQGTSVFPLTSLSLDYPASTERLSTGMKELDQMLNGGVYRGSSVLVSGVPGSGKTSVAAQFAAAACSDGLHALFLSFEEPKADLIRNMKSVGVELAPHIDSGRLSMVTSRPTEHSMEKHLMIIYRTVETIGPDVMIFDPMSSIHHAGTSAQARFFLLRLIDHLRSQGRTIFFTDLIRDDRLGDRTSDEVSSLMDTWIVVRDRREAERRRTLYILKARGIAHSNDTRELVLSNRGVYLDKPISTL